MTIKEAILSYPGLSDIPDNYISKVLVDRSIANDGAATYAIESNTTVALCAADCYMAIVASPDFSEGRFSMKFSRGAMRSLAEQLYRNNGEPEKANASMIGTGNAKPNWW